MSEIFCSLTGLGMINALGGNQDDFYKTIINGEPTGLTERNDLIEGKKVFAGGVNCDLPCIDKNLSKYDTRNNRLALFALNQMSDKIKETIRRFGTERTGVVVGSSTSGIASLEDAVKHNNSTGRLSPAYHIFQSELGSPSTFISRITGARGPSYTISTACSSGLKAIASSRRLIECGICDAVITGGVDSLCRLTLNGFNVLEVLSGGISRPVSKNRDGINIGEGAALFIMEKSESGIYAAGAGESNDAHHMSSPHPEGLGAEKAMRSAIKNAGLKPEDTDYISLHGTGTKQNDAAEAAAINRVFPYTVPCSSTKPLFGHTLGASGAMGAAVCYLLLSDSSEFLPPHCWDSVKDDSIPEIRLVEKGEIFQKKRFMMINSFAFGGNNCSLILGKHTNNG